MKKLYIVALICSLYSAIPVLAIDEQEIEQLCAMDPLATCEYNFQRVLSALDFVDIYSGRVSSLCIVGMGLIGKANEYGLTPAQEAVWYRALCHKIDVILSHLTADESLAETDEQLKSTRLLIIQMMARKEACIKKALESTQKALQQ